MTLGILFFLFLIINQTRIESASLACQPSTLPTRHRARDVFIRTYKYLNLFNTTYISFLMKLSS